MINMIEELNKEDNVQKLSVEQYNELSAVVSSYTRNNAIKEHGVRKGYFDAGLNYSTGRGRYPFIKNTGVIVTMNAVRGVLANIAKEIGGETWERYQKYLAVNSCSSKIRNSFRGVIGWTELCGPCYKDYNLYYNDCVVDETWDEYIEMFVDLYGVYPEDYGSWDEFYCIYSDTFEEVVEVYLTRALYWVRC